MFNINKNDHARQEWVKKMLKNIHKGKILDVGAGELKNKPYCSHLEYISQDFCQYDGSGDGSALQSKDWDTSKVDIVSDIIDIPVDNESFDYVVCTEVFEHIKYPVKALKEFYRLLKPGGGIIVTAPFCSLTHMAPYHMYSGFNRYWYMEIMKELGFVDIVVEANGNWFEYMIQEIRRVPFMAKKYSGSKASFMYKIAVLPMLLIMQFLDKKHNCSHELLCFGYHVSAKKPIK